VTDGGFDELSRALARRSSRRTALKAIGASVGATVGAVLLKPFRADAACPAGTTPCGTSCCSAGIACVDASTSKCGCAAGYAACGTGCCKGTCTDAATACCCEGGATPCGTACCQKGVSCYDASQAVCGCPSGTTPCVQNNVLTCAPKGQTCDSGGPWPVPNTRVKNCVGCKRFMDPCTSNDQCCSNVCNPNKNGGSCACSSDSDCPSAAPYCDPKTEFCHS
jgi:hypothetical protein